MPCRVWQHGQQAQIWSMDRLTNQPPKTTDTQTKKRLTVGLAGKLFSILLMWHTYAWDQCENVTRELAR